METSLHRSGSRSLSLAAVVGVAVVLLLTSWIWIDLRDRFPQLPAGSYIGELKNVFDEEESPTLFFVKSSTAGILYFMLNRDYWTPQVITSAAKGQNSGFVYPVTLIGPDRQRLKLVGRPAEGIYQGVVRSRGWAARGRWRLQPLPLSPLADLTAGEMELWLRLRDEAADVAEQVRLYGRYVSRQQEEITRLGDLVFGDAGAKEAVAEEYQGRLDEARQLEEALREAQDRARELEQRLDVARRLTPMGKLVALARESLEREQRWLESMQRASPRAHDEAWQRALQEAEQIQTLKQEIAREREQIYHLEQLSQQDSGRGDGRRDRFLWN